MEKFASSVFEAEQLCERGDAHSDQGDFDAAIAAYTQALRFNPDMLAAFVGRGIVSYKLKSWDKAIGDFTQALRRAPHFTVALINRGNAYIQRGDLDKAIADFSKAIEFDGESYRAYLGRSLAFEAQEKHRESEFDQQKAAVLASEQGVEI